MSAGDAFDDLLAAAAAATRSFRGLAQTADVSLEFRYGTPERSEAISNSSAPGSRPHQQRTPSIGADQPSSVVQT
jgi:hypothetical protein